MIIRIIRNRRNRIEINYKLKISTKMSDDYNTCPTSKPNVPTGATTFEKK